MIDIKKFWHVVIFIKEILVWGFVRKSNKPRDWFSYAMLLAFLCMFVAFEIMSEQAISQANKKYDVIKENKKLEEDIHKCESYMYYQDIIDKGKHNER